MVNKAENKPREPRKRGHGKYMPAALKCQYGVLAIYSTIPTPPKRNSGDFLQGVGVYLMQTKTDENRSLYGGVTINESRFLGQMV